ncbi:MAG: glycosyltransferase family 1 protein [Chryseolinea sp.]
MNVGFDAKRLFNNFTGLGNYSRFVVNALLDHEPENEYYLYTPGKKSHPEISAITSRPNVKVVLPPKLYSITGTSSLWRSWGMSYEDSLQQLDVFHGMSQELPRNMPKRIRKVVTIHDLIFLRFPRLYKSIDIQIYKAKALHACKSADKVVAISQQTAEDIISFFGIPESKITVVYQGCHPQFCGDVAKDVLLAARRRYNLPDRYLLNVGTVEERKNILMAVKALALVPENLRIPIVIMGRETAYKREVVNVAATLGIGHLIIFLHNVPFHDFPAIYQAAHLFLYPSLFEGFGIPVVEAIESGVPVITSTGSCFREAGGPSSAYVDPSRPEDLTYQIVRLSEDESARQQMIHEGRQYATRFQPAQIASDLFRVYREA